MTTKHQQLCDRIAQLEAALAIEIAARTGTQGRMVIERQPGDESALELVTRDWSGNLARYWMPDTRFPGQLVCGRYVNSGVHEFSCLSYCVSGTYTRNATVDGRTMLNILPPSNDPAMFAFWNDVPNTLIARSANIPPEESYFVRRYDWATSDDSNPALAVNLSKAVERFAERIDGQHTWFSRSGLKAVLDCGEGPPDVECDVGLYLQMGDGGKVWVRRGGTWVEAEL